MKIKEEIYFKEITYNDGDKRLFILTKDPKRDAISAYLTSDAYFIFDETIQTFNNILEGKEEGVYFSGNACYVEPHKDKTLVEMQFEIEEGAGYNTVEIETEDLRNLLILWRDKLKEYKEIGTIPELQK